MFSSDELVTWIDYALAKKAPDLIPRSGDRAEKVDCFTVYFEFNGRRYLLESRSGNTLRCKCWPLDIEGEREGIPAEVSVFEAWQAKPEIHHFFGYYEGTWSEWTSFAREQRFDGFRKRVRFDRAKMRIRRALQSRRKLVTTERMQLLNEVFKAELEDGTPPGITTLLRRVHGETFYAHPGYQSASRRMRTLLNGLVQTGELIHDNVTYRITGAGISALERYDEQARRHRETMRAQNVMAWLTFVLLVSAIVQAGLLKIPPVFSVEHWPWAESGASSPR